MNIRTTLPTLCALGFSALAMGCDGTATDGSVPGTQRETGPMPNLNLPGYEYRPVGTGINSGVGQVGVNDSAVDYGLALRTASLKLRGDLPTLAEIRQLDAAVKANLSDGSTNDPNAVYKTLVKGFIADTPKFSRMMVAYWRNQLRMGGVGPVANSMISGVLQDLQDTAANRRQVSIETAPVMMARLVVENKSMKLAFTQTTNNCPTYNYTTGTFTDGQCNTGAVMPGNTATNMGNNVPAGQEAGILTNPGFQGQYYSNFAFRRARLINEIFACTRYPAEFSQTPTLVGSALYTAPWPQDSITSTVSAPDTDRNNLLTFPRRRAPTTDNASATTNVRDVVYFDMATNCQNCHVTLNRRAPLFSGFDGVGYWSGQYLTKSMVHSVVPDSPFTQIGDYLPKGDTMTAWKFGKPASTFQQFGQAMADDPQVAKCFMQRAWNNAYSRDDIVNDLALVPDAVIADMTSYFMANDWNMKMALEKLYTDPNFIRF